MSAETPAVPECCVQCPHLDAFHGACTHPLRQAVVAELCEGAACPVFPTVRADAMRDLAERLE